MKSMTTAHTVRPCHSGGISRKPKLTIFATNELALRRFKSENNKTPWEYPDCDVYCTSEVYDWIVERQEDGILVVDDTLLAEMQSFHFYKEIILLNF